MTVGAFLVASSFSFLRLLLIHRLLGEAFLTTPLQGRSLSLLPHSGPALDPLTYSLFFF